MANAMAGEMATCACKAQGWIINRSNPLAPFTWFEIAHEWGPNHFVQSRRQPNRSFRFVLLDEGDWR